jgi:PKD repeat protein
MKATVTSVLILLAVGAAALAQVQCDFPPAQLTTTNVALTWGDPACTATSCPAGTNLSFLIQSLAVDFTCERYTFDWTFGDGTTARTSGPTVTHRFGAPGIYNVTVHISRPDSEVTLGKPVTISAPVPTLSITVTVALALCLLSLGLLVRR